MDCETVTIPPDGPAGRSPVQFAPQRDRPLFSRPLTASRLCATFQAMLTDEQVEWEIEAYDQKLLTLSERYMAGERSGMVAELQGHGDALICLLEEAPLSRRNRIDHLIDRYEALRISCMS
jgi:hypothetical protein